MKEHAVIINNGGLGGVCLASGWKRTAISAAHPDSSMSELIAKIERQCEIIGDLLVKNEQLRNRLRRIEPSTQSSPGQHSGLETAE
jgi:hypothetical protein